MAEPRATYRVKVGERVIDPLPNLHCLKCGRTLARMSQHDGRTAICILTPEGGMMYVNRAQLKCLCGAERSFYSLPMAAIRLGIVEMER